MQNSYKCVVGARHIQRHIWTGSSSCGIEYRPTMRCEPTKHTEPSLKGCESRASVALPVETGVQDLASKW